MAELDQALAAHDRGDFATAKLLLESPALAGHPVTERLLGLMHLHGQGIEQSYQQAASHLRRASNGGDAKAQLALAQMTEAGRGMTPDLAVAARWYRRAAEGGEVEAMHRLAVCYYDGIGVARDPAAALPWLERAAEAGDMDCALAYAALLFSGDGTATDPAKALPWARRAADAGLPEAAAMVPAIEAKVREGLASRGEPSDPAAQLARGLDLYFGRAGASADPRAAAHWLYLAAGAGSAAAAYDLSLLHAYGRGVTQDAAESLRWCRLAAERGHVRAQHRLSGFCLSGYGRDKDPAEALFWASLAARGGHQGAAKARDEIAQLLDQGAVAEIGRRAATFRPKRAEL